MVICKFFQQGYCRYANNCRFEHIYGQKYSYNASYSSNQNPQQNNTNSTDQVLNQVILEVNVALKSGQWLFSCYGPFKNKANIPGMYDTSPEEVRFSVYEAQRNGTLAETLNKLKQYQEIVYNNFLALSRHSNTISMCLQSLFKGDIVNSPFDIQIDENYINNVLYVNSENLNGINIHNHNSFKNNPVYDNVMTFQTFETNSIFPANTTPSANFIPSPVNSGFESVSTFSMATHNQDNNGMVQNKIVSPSDLFASANANLQKSLESQGNNIFYSSANKQVAADVFSASSNPFDKTTNASYNLPTGNIFNSSFGSMMNQQQSNNDSFYSKIESLTDEEISLYKEKSFHRGFIPEIAPPFDLCS